VASIVAGGVGALACFLARIAGKWLNTFDGKSDYWCLETRRWTVPFVLLALVPPVAGICVGLFMQGSSTLIVGFFMANTLLTPLMYWNLTNRIEKNRLSHVCFSVLLAWLILVPLYLINKRPLQLWFVAFPYSALLAIIGYLVAQGTKAIRDRSVEL
jgi:hypothetical protein